MVLGFPYTYGCHSTSCRNGTRRATEEPQTCVVPEHKFRMNRPQSIGWGSITYKLDGDRLVVEHIRACIRAVSYYSRSLRSHSRSAHPQRRHQKSPRRSSCRHGNGCRQCRCWSPSPTTRTRTRVRRVGRSCSGSTRARPVGAVTSQRQPDPQRCLPLTRRRRCRLGTGQTSSSTCVCKC